MVALQVEEQFIYVVVSFRHTDEFQFCCLAQFVDECNPPPNEFSSCEDLMSNHVLRISIWVLGVISLVGNGVVIFWRARDIYDTKVFKRKLIDFDT